MLNRLLNLNNFIYFFICFAVLTPANLLAQFFSGPESLLGISYNQKTNYSSQGESNYLSLSTFETPFSLQGEASESFSKTVSISYTQQSEDNFYHFALQNWQNDFHGAFGVSLNDLYFSSHFGTSDGIVTSRQNINGVAPNFFHGAVSYDYNYSGATASYDFTESVTLHGGAMFIDAPGLEDRSSTFLGLSYKNLSTTLSSVSRADETVGYSIVAGLKLNKIELAYQELTSKYDASWRELSIGFADNNSIGSLQLSLGAGNNELYDRGSETRVSMIYSIPLGKSSAKGKTKASYNLAHLNSQVKRSSESFNKLSRNSLNALGSGLALSSGNVTLDSSERFTNQTLAAFYTLSTWNPVSVANNREYGGSIYRNTDGTYSPSSSVAVGTNDSVSFNPYQLAPYGTTVTADWHTHGAYDPRYLNEEFSQSDILFSYYYNIDGYLGTPAGRMYLYDVSNGYIYQVLSPSGDEFPLPTN